MGLSVTGVMLFWSLGWKEAVQTLRSFAGHVCLGLDLKHAQAHPLRSWNAKFEKGSISCPCCPCSLRYGCGITETGAVSAEVLLLD